MTSLGTLLRTLRHLSPEQVIRRAVHEVRQRVEPHAGPATRLLYAPVPEAKCVVSLGKPAELSEERVIVERWQRGVVEIHGVERARDDWSNAEMSRLWRYERQYHRELPALAMLAPDDARALVQSWLAACPPLGRDAWEPYPVARRILNWSLALALNPALEPELAPHLAGQVRWLANHLERHLLGNHLLCDLCALVAGASTLEFSDSDAILKRALDGLAHELPKQLLADGGYAERTAQYHAIVLDDALLAATLATQRGVELPASLRNALEAMTRWLSVVRRADGSVPYLNDAAPGSIPNLDRVLSRAHALGISTTPKGHAATELSQTGWSIVRRGAHELLFEHGPIGPDEQPGHGHSDGLSFELIWDGERVVEDTGTTSYVADAVRHHERSATAHASITVDGQSPDELWAAFRVGARATISGEAARLLEDDVWSLRGSLLAPQGWRHERGLIFWPGRALVILDVVEGTTGHALAHLPLAPGWSWHGSSLRRGERELQLHTLLGMSIDAIDGWVSAGFGKKLPRTTLRFQADLSGRIAVVLAAPGAMGALEKNGCVIEHAGERRHVVLDARGLPT
ncbi:MAG: alginate lyase family protein [Deltaproteobacteria bacterium]|nr:alginate lyase family protein [Deltaproteobacteria bacterium]